MLLNLNWGQVWCFIPKDIGVVVSSFLHGIIVLFASVGVVVVIIIISV
jgi:hypothetical protein